MSRLFCSCRAERIFHRSNAASGRPSHDATCRPLLKLFASPIEATRALSDRSNARDLRQFSTCITVTVPLQNFPLELDDLIIKLLEVVHQPLNKLTERAGQIVDASSSRSGTRCAIFEMPCGTISPNCTEQTTNLVGLCSSRFHEAFSHPAHRKHGLLLNALDRHEPHVGARNRLANCLRVRCVTLFVLTYGLTNCGAISRTVCPKP